MEDEHISGKESRWTEAAVRQLLRRHSYEYQRIDLPFGLKTPGVDRRSTFEKIFPPDLTGKTVLDLGCNHGFFCFEALRRGARRVVGYDKRPHTIRGAKLLANCLGADVEFAVRDLDHEQINGRFDYVIALNVLHHLQNPISMIGAMLDAADEMVALELAIPGFVEMRELGIEPEQWFKLRAAPVLYLDSRGKYLMTPAIARQILKKHTKVASVTFKMSGFKDRYVVRAAMHDRAPKTDTDMFQTNAPSIYHPGDIHIDLSPAR